MTKLLLDSGDPQEYKKIFDLAKAKGQELWGSTTNPSLIAKKLLSQGKKLTTKEAFDLQKQLVLEITQIVPGAVSAEVYAEQDTLAEEMIRQGEEISKWHERVVVKLPTNLEGLKSRTKLREKGVTINNTLVFSQQQVFAITLHEKIMRREFGQAKSGWPSFISPFVGRLDDKGEDGLEFVKKAVRIVTDYFEKDLVWMLAASIRNTTHFKGSIQLGCDLMTVPATVFADWLNLSKEDQNAVPSENPLGLADIPAWNPSEELLAIDTVDDLLQAIELNKLDISHPLTTAGIERFVADWKTVLS